MWNHSTKSSLKNSNKIDDTGGGGDAIMEKVEKHLDLTNYINFLKNLFSLSTSDSESSDVESGGGVGVVASSSSLDALELNNPGSISSSLNVKTVHKSSSSLGLISTISSSSLFSQEGDVVDPTAAFVTSADLTPMSDIELNNLLKRTNYLGSSDVDPMTFDLVDHPHHEITQTPTQTATSNLSENNKTQNKKKKRKPKVNIKDLDEVPRQNRPNSGGSSGLGGSNNNGSVSDTSGNSRGSSNNSYNNNNAGGGGSGGGSQLKNCSSSVIVNCAQEKLSFPKLSPTPNLNCSEATTVLSSLGVKNLLPSSTSAINNNNPTTTKTCDISSYNSSSSSETLTLSASSFIGNNGVINKKDTTNCLKSSTLNKSKNKPFLDNGLDLLGLMDNDSNDSLNNYLPTLLTAANATAAAQFFPPEPFSDTHHDNTNGFLHAVGEDIFSCSDDNSPLSSLGSLGSEGAGGDETTNNNNQNNNTKKHGIKRKGDSSSPSETDNKHKKLILQKQEKFIELMNFQRKKIYVGISKKEVPKTQRAMFNTHKDQLDARKRLADACSKFVQEKAIRSQKTTKDSTSKAKRLSKEMLNFWKQTDRTEKENRKRKDKDDVEQRKQSVDVLAAKQLQQNLNFLITETELYANFIVTKLHNNNGDSTYTSENLILDRIIQDRFENQSIEGLKIKSKIHAAVEAEKIHSKLYQVKVEGEDDDITLRTSPLFSGILKNYQTLGINWLAKLFDHGINGVLADEMNLGKTIQAIAFLAFLAERYNIWGPFLVIAPLSSLHHWQQEIQRCVPDFKIVPYWGNPQERKILRQFWQQTNLHTPNASFHVVVTSYNVVVQDLKYFNKMKWQYLILDDAQQAIKTNVSTRWKALIGFNCRNRLLLTGGIPIQNSFNEILSLLHFIMPFFFLSQEDFGDWFSKDVESNPESRTALEKNHLIRLNTVLQQFMLRRTKKDVKSELCDIMEIFIPCPLTTRQRFFHSALVRKIITEDLLKVCSTSSSLSDLPQHDARNLQGLVMQFRKVVNHPDLFERRDMKSPLFMDPIIYSLPKLVLKEQLEQDPVHCARNYLLKHQFSLYNFTNISHSLFGNRNHSQRNNNLSRIDDVHVSNTWSFLRFCDLEAVDVHKLIYARPIERMMHLVKFRRKMCENYKRRRLLNEPKIDPFDCTSFVHEQIAETFRNAVFTSYNDSFYKWSNNELLGHVNVDQKFVIVKSDNQTVNELEPLYLPKFLFDTFPKIRSSNVQPYISDGPTFKWMQSKIQCSLQQFNLMLCESNPSELTWFEPSIVKNNILDMIDNVHGWSGILMPDKGKLITDSGKLMVLDGLLKSLKMNGHRVIIYSVLPKMMDLIEEYFRYRKWSYVRANSLKNHSDWKMKLDTFAILLTTTSKTGLLGVNLSKIDTVIFYDNDWNSTIEQHSMDLTDRLGQIGTAKQVTVYKLFCKGTIEDRIRKLTHKSETKSISIINGQVHHNETLTWKELLSLLLDDDDLDRKYRQRQQGGVEKASDKLLISTNHQSSHTFQPSTFDKTELQAVSEHGIVNGDANHLKVADANSGGSCQSPSSQDLSDDCDMKEMEFDITMYEIKDEEGDANPSNSDYFDNYSRAIEWNNGSTSDYEEDLPFIPKKPKLGRGTGKRGRPPSRVRVQMRDLTMNGGDLLMRRGPGRPRTKPIGPLNQGLRGRRPGRPPLSKKAETISVNLSTSPLDSSPHLFGIYNSQQDLDMSS